jgi:opacity protein-like surface antigen
MNSKALRTTFILVGMLAAVTPAWCQYRPYRTHRVDDDRDGELRLRFGAFRPEGDSQYWHDKELDFTGTASDLQGPIGGIDYLLRLNHHFSLMLSGSYYEGNATQSYRDFVDNSGHRIRHDTTLGIGSATLGVVYHFTGRGAPVSPYVGAGAGGYFWRLQENGDFIDFNHNNDIFNSRLRSDGTAFGGYLLVGLEAPITRNVSLFAEGRWTQVKDDLRDDFEGFGRLDLSGREVTGGIAWWI